MHTSRSYAVIINSNITNPLRGTASSVQNMANRANKISANALGVALVISLTRLIAFETTVSILAVFIYMLVFGTCDRSTDVSRGKMRWRRPNVLTFT